MINLGDRKEYIGGSDASAVLQMSRWETPLSIWMLKTGAKEYEEKDSIAIDVGNELEDYVARKYTKETGNKVQRKKATIVHPEYPFIRANIDRRLIGVQEGLECKTTTAYKEKEWSEEEIPQEYIIQCMHYLAVTGWKRWHIACLIGNHKFVHKVIERDEEFIREIIDREVYFWREHVEKKKPPFEFITHMDKNNLFDMYPTVENEEPIVFDSDIDEKIERLYETEKNINDLKKIKETLENELKAFLKESKIGKSSKYQITWGMRSSGKKISTKKIKENRPKLFNLLFDRFGYESESRVLTKKILKEEK